jgi:hypothetical protein
MDSQQLSACASTLGLLTLEKFQNHEGWWGRIDESRGLYIGSDSDLTLMLLDRLCDEYGRDHFKQAAAALKQWWYGDKNTLLEALADSLTPDGCS